MERKRYVDLLEAKFENQSAGTTSRDGHDHSDLGTTSAGASQNTYFRDRILLALDVTNALPPSELFAFRGKRFEYQASALTVAETVYKGDVRDWGKTKKSLAAIHIPKELADDLETWRVECQARARQAAATDKTKSACLSPDDFTFTNEVGGFLETDNFRKRVLHKLPRDFIYRSRRSKSSAEGGSLLPVSA